MATAKAPISSTKNGTKVSLKALYVYPDGHTNLVFGNGVNWPFNDGLQTVEGLARLLRRMERQARTDARRR